MCFGLVGVDHVSVTELLSSFTFQTASILAPATASRCKAPEKRPPPYGLPFHPPRETDTMHPTASLTASVDMPVLVFLSLSSVCGCSVFIVVGKTHRVTFLSLEPFDRPESLY